LAELSAITNPNGINRDRTISLLGDVLSEKQGKALKELGSNPSFGLMIPSSIK
jgi:hypothetical protein